MVINALSPLDCGVIAVNSDDSVRVASFHLPGRGCVQIVQIILELGQPTVCASQRLADMHGKMPESSPLLCEATETIVDMRKSTFEMAVIEVAIGCRRGFCSLPLAFAGDMLLRMAAPCLDNRAKALNQWHQVCMNFTILVWRSDSRQENMRKLMCQ